MIGQVVATLANMLNPELIVLSGSIAQSNDTAGSAREAIYGASHPLVSRDYRSSAHSWQFLRPRRGCYRGDGKPVLASRTP